MTGWLIGLLVVFGGLIFWKILQDRIKDREKIRIRLESEWGRPVRSEYSDKIWSHISSYYEEQKRNQNVEYDIDAITWNDLNLSAVFEQMNHTRTSAGEMMLFSMLRKPLFREDGLKKRDRMISAIQMREKERIALEEALLGIGKTDRFSVYEYLLKIRDLKAFSRLPHFFCAGLLFVGTLLLFFLPAWYLLVYLGILLFNTFFYFHEKGKHIRDISLFRFIFQMLCGCEAISVISFPELAGEISEIKELTGHFHKYRRFHFFVAGGDKMHGSVFDSVLDYIRILFHIDLIKISTMAEEIKKYETELIELFEKTGELDAMLSVASYRRFLGDYTIPVFVEKGAEGGMDVRYHVDGLYHPLVKEPVKNSISVKCPVLLTGSNASGKSTFLKAAAISVLFAQTIHTVPARNYHAPFYRVYSSMALRDNILEKESYFLVEIKSLKRIFDAERGSEIPVFCFVDEILRGTNTVERVAASSVLLEILFGKHVMCMAATHDIELSGLLKNCYENYHFEERIENGDVSFDYLLKKGTAKSRNAILLMECLGFEKVLTESAKERVEKFLQTGDWQ